MKVAIVRGGGIAGITTRTELSTDELGSEDAAAFVEKVEQASIGRSTRSRDESPAMPDATLYEVIVDDGSTATSSFSESTLPEPVRQLVEWIDARPEKTFAPEF